MFNHLSLTGALHVQHIAEHVWGAKKEIWIVLSQVLVSGVMGCPSQSSARSHPLLFVGKKPRMKTHPNLFLQNDLRLNKISQRSNKCLHWREKVKVGLFTIWSVPQESVNLTEPSSWLNNYHNSIDLRKQNNFKCSVVQIEKWKLKESKSKNESESVLHFSQQGTAALWRHLHYHKMSLQLCKMWSSSCWNS